MRLNLANELAAAVEVHELNVTVLGFQDAVRIRTRTEPFRFAADFAQRVASPIEFARGERFSGFFA